MCNSKFVRRMLKMVSSPCWTLSLSMRRLLPKHCRMLLPGRKMDSTEENENLQGNIGIKQEDWNKKNTFLDSSCLSSSNLSSFNSITFLLFVKNDNMDKWDDTHCIVENDVEISFCGNNFFLSVEIIKFNFLFNIPPFCN